MRLSARERGRRRPIHHPAVARALQEVDAGHHRVTQQRRHREDQRPRDHPVDEELVLGRIDRGHAVVVAFEVQSARRDDALQRFERRARRAGARRARLRADERARHLALERGRRPVRAQRRAGDLHLGRGLRWTGCAGFARRERHERSGRQRTGALRQERSAVEQPVARSLAGLVETAFTAWWAHRCPPRRGGLRAEGSRAAALLEVSNRGGKAALPYFARAAWSADPAAEAAFGDALPLRLGPTLIWVGWQFDVPLRDGVLGLDAPVATDGGRPIEGLVRCDWTVDEQTVTLPLGHRNHRPYPVADAEHPDNVLTERDGRLAPRRVVPRDQWRFVDGETRIARAAGFEPGKIYELVYRARDPVVVGIGLAAVRDMVAFDKYDASRLFPVR